MSFQSPSDLCFSDQAALGSIHAHSLLESLHSYLVRLSGITGDVGAEALSLDIHDRDSFAMALVLFSVRPFLHRFPEHRVEYFKVANSSTRQPCSPNSPLSYRPQTQNLLLQIVQELLDDNPMRTAPTTIMPRETLDSALVILLNWGSFVPWCWTSWTDSRHTSYETILLLVRKAVS